MTAGPFVMASRSIAWQLQLYLNGHSIPWSVEIVDGQIRYTIRGERMTPDEAADRYLSGWNGR